MIVCFGWYCFGLHQSRDTARKRLVGLVIVAVPSSPCCVSTSSTLRANESDKQTTMYAYRLFLMGLPF
jgi:hypothetical protein